MSILRLNYHTIARIIKHRIETSDTYERIGEVFGISLDSVKRIVNNHYQSIYTHENIDKITNKKAA